MRQNLIAFAAGFMVWSATARAETAETLFTNNVKVLRGPDGSQLRLLHGADNRRALVQIVRSDAIITGQVLTCDIVDVDRGRRDYVVSLGRSRWRILRAMGSGRYLGWLPGVGEQQLRSDDRASDRARPGELIAGHYGYRAAARGHRGDLAAEDAATFARLRTAASTQCRANIGGAIDSSAATAGDLARYDVGARCGRYLQALQKVCGDELGREAVARQIERVRCVVGKPGLRLTRRILEVGLDLRQPLSRWQISERLEDQL